jgi:AraC-like DNA-binding protein
MQNGNFIPSRHYERIKPAIDIIHNGFLQSEPSIADLAAACGMGESYFQRLFKEKYGMPPKKYMIQLKVNHACELLRMERYNVSQVAEMSGFSDVYFFSRQFKGYMGITPTAFVKKYVSSK